MAGEVVTWRRWTVREGRLSCRVGAAYLRVWPTRARARSPTCPQPLMSTSPLPEPASRWAHSLTPAPYCALPLPRFKLLSEYAGYVALFL